MCIFIGATLPKGADLAALNQLARAYQRHFWSQENESVERQIGPAFGWFLTTHGHCDCGTSLGCALERQRRATDWSQVEQKLVGRGWSRTKVDRTLAQMREQRQPRASVMQDDPDLERWQGFIEAVLGSGLTQELGLLVRMYSGSQSDAFDIRARKTVKVGDIAATLPRMEQDVLYAFKARR